MGDLARRALVAQPAASTRPAASCLELVDDVRLTCRWNAATARPSAGGAAGSSGRRSARLRSMISARATMDAMISGQIGQPMACTIANT
jgi:hypothetical protein